MNGCQIILYPQMDLRCGRPVSKRYWCEVQTDEGIILANLGSCLIHESKFEKLEAKP